MAQQDAIDAAILGALAVISLWTGGLILSWVIRKLFSGGKRVTRRVISGAKKSTHSVKKIGRSTESKEKIGKSHEDQILEIDDVFYAQAANEIAPNNLRLNEENRGLWVKSLAIAEGDQAKQEATYIRLRAKQLRDEHADNLRAKQLRKEHADNLRAKQLRKERADKLRAKQRRRGALLWIIGLIFIGWVFISDDAVRNFTTDQELLNTTDQELLNETYTIVFPSYRQIGDARFLHPA